MTTHVAVALLVVLSQTGKAENIPTKAFAKGIILLPLNRPAKVKASPLLVVRDTKAYARFLDRIPGKQISRTRPAPFNKDPLLQRPPVDFKRHTLLILTRPSMTRPTFQAVNSSEKVVTVTAEFPRELPAARPIHIGTYTAALIPQTSLPIHLKLAKP